MKNKIPSYLLQSEPVSVDSIDGKMAGFSFLDRTILNSANTIKSIYLQAENSAKDNIIRKINPHLKLLSLLVLALVISLLGDPFRQMVITAFILLLYVISGIKILEVYRKIFLIAFLFGFLVVFPASLNIITHGKIIFNLITFSRPYHFWIYTIPQQVGFTENGLQVVELVFLRVLNSVSFALLIVYTTPFPSFVKSFRIIGIPDTFLMIITLAYKFIFILARTIEETYFALKSKLLGKINNSSIRKLVSGRVFYIFRRSVIIYENTYFAMVSRGYNGKIKLHSDHPFTVMDTAVLVIIVIFGAAVLFFK